eukprot:gene12391-15144_t
MKHAAEIVLVTGGTGSLGGEMCTALRRAGHTVYFTSRSSIKIAELEASVNAEPAAGAAIRGIKVDLLVDGYCDLIEARFQADGVRPTALVNNARNLDFLKVSDGVTARSDFAGEFAMGVIVPYELALRWTGESGGSVRNIVNIASIYGVVVPNRALYDEPKGHKPPPFWIRALLVLTCTGVSSQAVRTELSK